MLCSNPVVAHALREVSRRTRLGLVIAAATFVGVGILAHPATAAAWHPGIDAAAAAAAASGRPVFAVVSARWAGQEATVLEEVLNSPEADAVITACFEPVRVDADIDAAFVRQCGITRVPAGCILTADGSVRCVFDMPTTTVEFVAVVARLAQQNARPVGDGSAVASPAGPAPAAASGSPESIDTKRSVRVFEEASPFAGTGLVESVPKPQGSISVVTAKLRRLSSFARAESDDGSAVTGPAAPGFADHGTPVNHSVASATALEGIASTAGIDEPMLSSAPPGWPAERTGPLVSAPTAPPSRTTIEPVGTVAPPSAVASGPWMDSARQPSPSVDPWGRPVTTPTVAPAPAVPPTAAPEQQHAAASPASFGQAPVQPQPQVQASGQQPGAAPDSGTVADATPTEPQEPGRASSLLAALQKPFSIFKRSTSPAEATPTMPPARPQPAAGTQAAAPVPAGAVEAPDVHGSMPLGLEGYCPVTLVDHGTWAEGRVQWGARHRGRTYLFAGAEQQQTFLANPDRYAPALSGDDPVLAMESGARTPGQRRYGVTYQSRMYLFATPETRATFAADPTRYSASVLVAERGRQVADGTRRY